MSRHPRSPDHQLLLSCFACTNIASIILRSRYDTFYIKKTLKDAQESALAFYKEHHECEECNIRNKKGTCKSCYKMVEITLKEENDFLTESELFEVKINEYPIDYEAPDEESKMLYITYSLTSKPYIKDISTTIFKDHIAKELKQQTLSEFAVGINDLYYAKFRVSNNAKKLYLLEYIESGGGQSYHDNRELNLFEDINDAAEGATDYYGNEHWRRDCNEREEIEKLSKKEKEKIIENIKNNPKDEKGCYNCLATGNNKRCLKELKKILKKDKFFKCKFCQYESCFIITEFHIQKKDIYILVDEKEDDPI